METRATNTDIFYSQNNKAAVQFYHKVLSIAFYKKSLVFTQFVGIFFSLYAFTSLSLSIQTFYVIRFAENLLNRINASN